MLIPVLVASALAIPAYRSYPRDVATANASFERLRKKQYNDESRAPGECR